MDDPASALVLLLEQIATEHGEARLESFWGRESGHSTVSVGACHEECCRSQQVREAQW